MSQASGYKEGQTSDRGATAFARSIRECIEFAGQLPPGWRATYLCCMKRLRAMDCRQRSEIVVSPPIVRGDGIGFLHVGADRPVLGVLRRTEARIAASCADCGRAGRLRRIGGKTTRLCPECYAPRALRLEAGLALKRLSTVQGAQPADDGAGLVLTPRLVRALGLPSQTFESHSADCATGRTTSSDRPTSATMKLEILVKALGPVVHARGARRAFATVSGS